MKVLFNRFISFLFIFIFLSFSIILFPMPDVKAKPYNSWSELGEDITYLLFYLESQTGAILKDYDFAKFMQNKESWDNYWNEENVQLNTDTQEIVFSDDFIKYIKQGLIEYAEETNGFRLYPTIDYDLVPASEFKSSYDYKTFRNLVSESGCIVLNTGYFSGRTSGLYVGRPFHDITKDSISLVVGSSYSGGIIVDARFYGTNTWTWYKTSVKWFATQYIDSDGYSSFHTFTSWEEGEDVLDQTATNIDSGFLDIRGLYPTGSVRGNTFFSDDGRKLKVFNSLNALKNYTTGNRSVYFGSGFYDDPGEVKVSFDDLEKYLDGKYDSFFDDLKDLIGDKEDDLTEEDLEKLVDKILDKMDDIGGNNKPGDNTGDNSGILDGISGILEDITSTISGYLDAILMYLESILTDLDYIVLELQDMTEEEVDTKSDSVISELSDAFSEIGDVMSQKFPFSIPWDIKNLYVALSGGKEPGIQSLSDDIGISGLYHDSSPPSVSGGKLIDVIVYPSPDDGTMPLVADEDMGNITPVLPSGDASFTDSGAPVFKIPFVIRSAGVNAAVLIDMSYFDIVSEFSRTMFLLIFLHQLFLLSMRVFEFVKSFMG